MAIISKHTFFAMGSLLDSGMKISEVAVILGENPSNIERAATFYYAARGLNLDYLLDSPQAKKYPTYASYALDSISTSQWVGLVRRLRLAGRSLEGLTRDLCIHVSKVLLLLFPALPGGLPEPPDDGEEAEA